MGSPCVLGLLDLQPADPGRTHDRAPRTPYTQPRAPSSRFLPPDPSVHEPYRLTPGLALRVGIVGAVALAAFAVLFFRLWSLQVLR